MKNLKFLFTILMCSILLTGCTLPEMPWSKKQAQEPVAAPIEQPMEIPSEMINETAPQSSDITLDSQTATTESIADPSINLELGESNPTGEISFGNEEVSDSLLPDLTLVPNFVEETTPVAFALNGITLKDFYTSVAVDSDGFTSYKLVSGDILRAAYLNEVTDLDVSADTIINAACNSSLQCKKSTVTMCGVDARLITATATNTPNSSILLLFNNQNTSWVLQVQYPKEKDGMTIATALFNKISLTAPVSEFGAGTSTVSEVNESKDLPYKVQLMNSKSYLEFSNISFKEPEGGFRDDVFCTKDSGSPSAKNRVAYGFQDSKCEFSYIIEDTSGLTEEQYLAMTKDVLAEKTGNPGLFFAKASTLPNEPYFLSCSVDENVDLQQFIYIKDSKAHIFTYRIVDNNYTDSDKIQDTLKTIILN